jgi:hypothetical protein
MAKAGQTENKGRGTWELIEFWAAILMAAATVATAYSAYEATRWGGVQATAFTQAGAHRTESAKSLSAGFSKVSIDANLFTQYAVAFTQGNKQLQTILVKRFFRQEFLPAFNAWVKQHPRTNPKAAKNPFVLPAYQPKDLLTSDKLEAQATASFDEGKEANQTSDNYVLGTIFFAGVLFFAGLGSQFKSERVAFGALAFATIVFLSGLTRLLTLPFH